MTVALAYDFPLGRACHDGMVETPKARGCVSTLRDVPEEAGEEVTPAVREMEDPKAVGRQRVEPETVLSMKNSLHAVGKDLVMAAEIQAGSVGTPNHRGMR